MQAQRDCFRPLQCGQDSSVHQQAAPSHCTRVHTRRQRFGSLHAFNSGKLTVFYLSWVRMKSQDFFVPFCEETTRNRVRKKEESFKYSGSTFSVSNTYPLLFYCLKVRCHNFWFIQRDCCEGSNCPMTDVCSGRWKSNHKPHLTKTSAGAKQTERKTCNGRSHVVLNITRWPSLVLFDLVGFQSYEGICKMWQVKHPPFTFCASHLQGEIPDD